MQVWNQTGYVHQFTVAMDKAAHEYIVVVVKGTFDFPETPGGPVRNSAEQVPLVFADTQTGEPGYSATLWETDFAFRKPRCDVIANGCAYAPGVRPAERVPVGIKVGNWSKLFEVVGHREWRAIGPVFTATAPQPFLKLPISYDVAWGGVDKLDPEDKMPPIRSVPAGHAPGTSTSFRACGCQTPRRSARKSGRPLATTRR
jgi:hypothetical protein